MTITIFSTPTCGYCTMAKEFFKEHDISFADFDVSADAEKAQEMVKKSCQMGVPVIVFEDKEKNIDEFVVGFDKERIMKILGMNE